MAIEFRVRDITGENHGPWTLLKRSADHQAMIVQYVESAPYNPNIIFRVEGSLIEYRQVF